VENTEWVWLKHEGTNGLWKAPAGVVEDAAKQGWYPTEERPVEPNPATAEMPREWFEPAPEPVKKSSKRASASTEGTDTDG
jgi:hypothetical protein